LQLKCVEMSLFLRVNVFFFLIDTFKYFLFFL
jgi:hypothetical protein